MAAGRTSLGLQDSHAESPAAGAAPQGVPVSVAAVLQKDIALWDEFSGRLEAVQCVEVRPRVAGALQAVHFKESALVKQGDLLVTVDPAPYAADVDRAEAQVAAAQARVPYTRSELDRSTRLLQESAIAQREYDERQNAYREADANLRAAQAALQTARLNLSYTQARHAAVRHALPQWSGQPAGTARRPPQRTAQPPPGPAGAHCPVHRHGGAHPRAGWRLERCDPARGSCTLINE